MSRALRKAAIGLGAAVLSLPLGAAATTDAPRPKPMRIMSMNLCTDLMVLQLVPRDRIVSVTYLTHNAVALIRPGLDAGIRINHGTAEEILTQKPDLILAGDFSTAMTKKLARQIGAPLIEVKSATTFEDIRASARQIGQAVGEPKRAEALVAEMNSALSRLAATASPRPYVVAAWSGESVPGKQTLANTIIEAAGAINVAALSQNTHYNTFGIEELLAAKPEVLMYSSADVAKPTLMNQAIHHRAVRKLFENRQITYPEPLFSCGLPQSARAAVELRHALINLTGRH